jgi:hypothetical protein
MVNPGDAFPPGEDWIVRQIADLQRQINANASARSLESSSIGAGGLTVNNGGSITITGGGSISVNGSDLAAAIVQLNSNADVGSNIQSFGGASLTGANQIVATVTLTKPAWATRAVILATSVVTTNTVNQATAPLNGTMKTVIAGTSSTSIDISTQADSVFTTKVVPLNRNFATATNVTVTTTVSTTGGAAGNALSAQLAVTVFWFPS